MNAARKACTGLALLAAGFALNAHADSFGTLFTTPEQRAQLDSATLPASAGDEAGAGVEGAATATVHVIRLDGTMVSSLGRKELWINGEAASGQVPAGIRQARVRNDGLVSIRLDQRSASRALKPGQLYLPDSGEIQEAYQSDVRQDRE